MADTPRKKDRDINRNERQNNTSNIDDDNNRFNLDLENTVISDLIDAVNESNRHTGFRADDSEDPYTKPGRQNAETQIGGIVSIVNTVDMARTTHAANKDFKEHWGSTEERSRTNRILDESIGGKINTEEHFGATAAANFLQSNGVTATYKDTKTNLDVEVTFNNDVRLGEKVDHSDLFTQIVNGNMKMPGSDKIIDTNKLRVLGSRADKKELSLSDYAKKLQEAYTKDSKSAAEIKQIQEDFINIINQLTLVNEYLEAGADGTLTQKVEYYGANVNVDMSEFGSIRLINNRNAGVKVRVGGGIDYLKSIQNLLNGNANVERTGEFQDFKFKAKNIRKNHDRAQTMTQEAQGFILGANSRVKSREKQAIKELEQYKEYILNEIGADLTEDQKFQLVNFIDQRHDRMSEEDTVNTLVDMLKSFGISGSKLEDGGDLKHILTEAAEVAKIRDRYADAARSRERESGAVGKVKDEAEREFRKSDYDREALNEAYEMKRAVRYTKLAGGAVWHTTLGTLEFLTDTPGKAKEFFTGRESNGKLKRFSERVRNVRKAPGERKKKKQQKKKDKKTKKREKKSLRKKALKKLLIAALPILIILLICVMMVAIIGALVTCMLPSFMEEDSEFNSVAEAVLENLEEKAQNEHDAIWDQLQNEVWQLQTGGASGSVSASNITVNYYNMLGDKIIATIVSGSGSERTYVRKTNFTWSDAAPQNYINAKQIMAAADFVLTDEYGQDLKKSDAIALTSEIYDATHSASYDINTYTTDDGKTYITGATVNYYVVVAGTEEYRHKDATDDTAEQKRKEKIDLIVGPLQAAQDSSMNTTLKDDNKSSFRYAQVLDIYENVISQNWESLYGVSGYDLYDNGGGDGAFEYVADEILVVDDFYSTDSTILAMQMYNGFSMSTSYVGGLSEVLPPGSYRISSVYGKRRNIDNGKQHSGTDLAAPAGTPIYAAASGTVTLAKDNYCTCVSRGNACPHNSSPGAGFGNVVFIQLDDPYNGKTIITVYGHMLKGSIQVKKGQHVEAGECIGAVGSSGRSTGYHLHFGAYVNIVASQNVINPAPFLVYS